jgi:RNA polymerase sigma-70 factor (ECF subfamily)
MQKAVPPDFRDPLFEVINGCMKGDRKCQQIIYEKFYGKMLAVCMRYSKSREEARDILQDGFIKVFTNIKKYGSTGSFEGWLRRIMINTAIDNIRRSKHLLQSTVPDDITDTSDEVNDEEENNKFADITSEQIMEAIQQLSPAYRTVFNMYVIDGYSHKEIAQRLGISEGASKSNLAKAKRNLRKILMEKKS